MASVETVKIGETLAGTRLDRVLAAQKSIGSREAARRALSSGKVELDGRAVGAEAAGFKVDLGLTIDIYWARPGTGKRSVRLKERLLQTGIEIIYEDAQLLAVNKPAGLLTDAATPSQAKHRDTLKKELLAYLDGAFCRPVHRIDRDTSGVVLFVKTEEAKVSLIQQWAERSPVRSYWTLVHGVIEADSGRWSNWMLWDKKARIQREVESDWKGAFYAECDYKVVERLGSRATLLEVRLVSGRRNQIRLQGQLRGHSLLGDYQYRSRDLPKKDAIERQALHAQYLEVIHPTTGKRMCFDAPLPTDLKRGIKALRRPVNPAKSKKRAKRPTAQKE